MDLYKLLLEHWEIDNKRTWNLFSLLSIAQAALLNFSTGLNEHELYFLTTIAVALCILWWAMQLRMSAWIQWWEVKIREIEPIIMTANFQGNKNFTLFINRKLSVEKGLSTKLISTMVPWLFILIWIGMAFIKTE